MFLRKLDMASHSGAVTVEVAPVNSAVSVVGTGVELGARTDAMLAMMDACITRWMLSLPRDAYVEGVTSS